MSTLLDLLPMPDPDQWRLEDHLAPEHLSAVVQRARWRDVDPGEVLVVEGSLDRSLLVIEGGTFGIEVAGTEVAQAVAGDIIGEMAFLDDRPRSASVVARTPGFVYELSRAVLLELDSASLLALTGVLAERMSNRHRATLFDREMPSAWASSSSFRVPADIPSEFAAFHPWMQARVRAHAASNHPYFEALGSRSFPDDEAAVQDLLVCFYEYSAHRTQFLASLLGRLEPGPLREAVGDILLDRLGGPARAAAAQQWAALLPPTEPSAAGLPQDQLEIVRWRESFDLQITGGTVARAIGAVVYGMDLIDPSVLVDLVATVQEEGRPRFSPVSEQSEIPRGAAGFRERLRPLVEWAAASEQGRAELCRGASQALDLRASFWTWMMKRAESLG